jgi:hypothetical protein
VRVLVGTVLGLFEFGAGARHALAPLAGREVTALAREGRHTWWSRLARGLPAIRGVALA